MEIVDDLAKAPRGAAFLFQPAGSIAVDLEGEYQKSGKPFLLVRGGGGVGIYPPEAHWLVPAGAGIEWMEKHLGPLIAWVDVPGGKSPAVSAPPKANVFRHTGDIGDCLASLPAIRQLGGGRLVISNHPEHAKLPSYYLAIKGTKYEALRPLLAAQRYITEVTYDESGKGITHDFAYFRNFYESHTSLAQAHASHAHVENLDLSPWLEAEPDPRSAGRVIVARSPRYQNPEFPWRKVGEQIRPLMLFIGHPEEHRAFQHVVNGPVDYIRTADFLEVARLIAGSRLFMGNQSSPCWVAMGLGHPLIQETAKSNPDSIIPRDNAVFCAGRQVDLGRFGF